MPFRTIKGKKVFIKEDSEIPPKHIFDEDRLVKHDNRFFLVEEGFADSLAVDEFAKKAKDLFEFKRHIAFTQSAEQTTDLLEVTGGGKKSFGGEGLELANEKKLIEGLDSSGALDESNFGDT